MAYRRRTPTLILLAVALVRVLLNVVDLVLRALVWLLLRVCWLLEAAIDRLRDDSKPAIRHDSKSPSPAVVRRKTSVASLEWGDATRTPVPPTDDVSRLMRVLGTKDRAFAELLMARGEKVKVS